MKLFVSITVPRKLSARIDAILPSSTYWRKTDPEQFHITLRYIGKVSAAVADRIRKELRAIDFTPFSLTFSDIGVFPENGAPRVIWLGIENSGPLEYLAREIDKAIYPAVQAGRDKPFSPHITLARVRKSKQNRAEMEKRLPTVQNKTEFNVESFQLMKSEQSSAGVEHILLENFSPPVT